MKISKKDIKTTFSFIDNKRSKTLSVVRSNKLHHSVVSIYDFTQKELTVLLAHNDELTHNGIEFHPKAVLDFGLKHFNLDRALIESIVNPSNLENLLPFKTKDSETRLVQNNFYNVAYNTRYAKFYAQLAVDHLKG